MAKPRKTSLGAALSAAAGEREQEPKAPPPRRAAKKRSKAAMGATTNRADRAGRVNVTGYFDPAVKQSLRMIQAKHPELSQQAILAEALNLVFAKYGVPESAEVK